MKPMDWMFPHDDFGSPHDWRHFAVPALIALGLNFAALALLRLPAFFTILPQSSPQPLQVELQRPQEAKPKAPDAATPVVQEPRVTEHAVAQPAAPIPKQAPHIEHRSKPHSGAAHAEQPVLTRQKLYDSARQVIEAMSEAKSERILMGNEMPAIPRQFRHTKKRHGLLLHQWESHGAHLYLRNGQCFTNPRLASQAGVEALPMNAQRLVGTLSIKASGIKCPWDKSSDEPFHFHIHPFKDIHPLAKPGHNSR